MPQDAPLTHATLRTPKAAAIAGILFSVLQALILWLLRISLPADPLEAGAWLKTNVELVLLALNLIPFAGIAFLWFIGVLRDRLGPLEDRFFATVFLGSALLFLAMLFVAAAAIGAIILTAAAVADPNEVIGSVTLHFARAFAYNLINVYAIKVAGVFMISTSTVAIFTRFAPRWIAILGYILALTLLLGSYYISWSFIVFPAWVLLISLYIVIDNFRGASPVDPSQMKIGS
ncbi:hypothetical protein [Microvirga terrestris]|uniref:DUF4386 family protein n=1 Tax=Microvirga terrestris TaxID=2791024 RepID=A0ABS0HUH6_9HYPH|nr:hypothetical protein [Microvirga terrestris]MBF9196936.1 hypothetical protein [Microvirga terrestris]